MCERTRSCSQCGKHVRGGARLYWGQCKRCLDRRRGVAVNRSPVVAECAEVVLWREVEGTNDDMTEVELDAIIEEQRQCLPDWWSSEHGR